MKLFLARSSPYARMALIVIAEKGLEGRVRAIEVQPRVHGSPYYLINPSGRVPFLVRDDGTGLEESALICTWLDRVDGKPVLEVAPQQEWEARRLEAMARSTLDGLAVWSRELRRPQAKRSSFIIRVESARFDRLADVWEQEADHPLLQGSLNMAQLTLACALGFEVSVPGLEWRARRPRLAAWHVRISARPSFARNPNPPVPTMP
jgi:glutathione S-transferase